jgi:hypothetical protein
MDFPQYYMQVQVEAYSSISIANREYTPYFYFRYQH